METSRRSTAISTPTQILPEREQFPPYTLEEIHAMINQSERDLAEGRYRDIDELFSEWDEEGSTVFAAEPEIEYNSHEV